MVAAEDGLIYIALPGDPLKNFMVVRHFFGDDFKICDEDVLVQIKQLLDANIKIQGGEYQTYLVIGNIFIPWTPLKVSRRSNLYRFSTSKEMWCEKKLGDKHIYFPDENSRILFEKYFGIR